MFVNSTVVSIKAILYVTNGLIQYGVCYCVPSQAITDETIKTMVSYAMFMRTLGTGKEENK
ncbi:hypothetical protein NQ315_000060 [Exocentrus adspersus]|uniref:Uncharacterized protein n=1 Tax=Exocentrus adspersus TaxID=1586481 RepID=A0AAV8VU45_9CUCU|nr:hypothetical protein NQ315_000060 [Exocentrus adspersus]